MAESTSPTRIEPVLDPGAPSAHPAAQNPVPAVQPGPMPAGPNAVEPVPSRAPSTLQEQLARLEDKTSRIEEKLSRTEGFTARVIDRFEASSHRMAEIAQQSELMAVRSETKFISRRIRALPGFPAVILASVVTAVLSSVLTILVIRLLPSLIGR